MRKIFEDDKPVSHRYPITVQVYAPDESEACEPTLDDIRGGYLFKQIPLPYLVRLVAGESSWVDQWSVAAVSKDSDAIRIAIKVLDAEYCRQLREEQGEKKS